MDRLKLPFISPSSPSSRTPMVITFFIWQFSRDGGDNGLFITQVTKVLYRFNVSWLKTFGTSMNFDWLVYFIECTNDSTAIEIYKRGNFVYHYLWWTSIYRPLSNPFRSHQFPQVIIINLLTWRTPGWVYRKSNPKSGKASFLIIYLTLKIHPSVVVSISGMVKFSLKNAIGSSRRKNSGLKKIIDQYLIKNTRNKSYL